jgi:hypothetical protein
MRAGAGRLTGMRSPNPVLSPLARTPLIRRIQFGIPAALLGSMVLLAVVLFLARNKELAHTLMTIEGVVVFVLLSLSSGI